MSRRAAGRGGEGGGGDGRTLVSPPGESPSAESASAPRKGCESKSVKRG